MTDPVAAAAEAAARPAEHLKFELVLFRSMAAISQRRRIGQRVCQRLLSSELHDPRGQGDDGPPRCSRRIQQLRRARLSRFRNEPATTPRTSPENGELPRSEARKADKMVALRAVYIAGTPAYIAGTTALI